MQPNTAKKQRLKRIGEGRLDDLPSLLLQRAITELEIHPNVTRIAKALGIYQTKLWHYWHGRSRWPADEWLKAMICLGYVVESPRAFEIHLPKVSALCELYDALKDFNPGDRSHSVKQKDDDHGKPRSE